MRERDAGQRSRHPRGCGGRRALALALVVGLLATPGCASVKRWAYEDFGQRDEWQQPERVVAALNLARGDHVADLGAGSGYFTLRLADAVGPHGRVYAVDVDDAMLDHVAKEAAEAGATQVVPLRAAPDDPNLPDPVDLVFTSNTYHHLGERVDYLRRLRDDLRPGGRVAVVEFHSGSHATPPETIAEEMREAGYVLVTSPDFLERQSFTIWRPAE